MSSTATCARPPVASFVPSLLVQRPIFGFRGGLNEVLITFSRCALNVVCIEMNARPSWSHARLRIDKSVFQVDGIVRASAEQAAGTTCGLPRNIKDSKCFLPSGSTPARSCRCERTHDIKRDTAKMGTLIVETSESE